jgi:hypothetical protein
LTALFFFSKCSFPACHIETDGAELGQVGDEEEISLARVVFYFPKINENVREKRKYSVNDDQGKLEYRENK